MANQQPRRSVGLETAEKRAARIERIAELADEIYHSPSAGTPGGHLQQEQADRALAAGVLPVEVLAITQVQVTPGIVEAVLKARREEYFERQDRENPSW